MPLAVHTLFGFVLHMGVSGGAVAVIEAVAGGQIFIFNLELQFRGFEG